MIVKKAELSKEAELLDLQIKARKEIMENKFKENILALEGQKKQYEEFRKFFSEERGKHKKWLKEVLNEREKIKSDLDIIAETYARKKILEKNRD